MQIENVSPYGILRINFSEKLKSFEDLKNSFKRMLFTEDFLEIQYTSNIDGCTTIRPELQDWSIITFDNYKMEIFLNFSNPVYVSSNDLQDELIIRVKEQFLFESLLTNVTIKQNYTTIAWLPPQVNADDTS